MTVNDNYHAVAMRACDFNMIGSDECQVVAAKIHTGQMSKWHFAWLIPAEIICNLGAILLSVVSALAHVIMGVALTIFAACTGDAEKKLTYNLRAAEHFASSLSAITDKVGTSFVRLVMPKTEVYSCVRDSIFNSLSKGHIKNYLFEQMASGLRQSMQQQGLGQVPTHQIDSVLRPLLDPVIDQAIDNGQVEQLPGMVQALLPQLIQQLQNAAQNRGQRAGGPQMQPGIPQMPQGGGPNWGGMPPMRPGQNQPMNFGGGHGFGGAQGFGNAHEDDLSPTVLPMNYGPEGATPIGSEFIQAVATGAMDPQAARQQIANQMRGASQDILNQAFRVFDLAVQQVQQGGAQDATRDQLGRQMGHGMRPQTPIGGPGSSPSFGFGGGRGLGSAQGFMGQNMPPQIPIGGPGTFPTGFGFGGMGQQLGQRLQQAQQNFDQNFQGRQQQMQQTRERMQQGFNQAQQAFNEQWQQANQNFGTGAQQNAPGFPPAQNLGNAQVEAQLRQVFEGVAGGTINLQAARQQITNLMRGAPQALMDELLQGLDAVAGEAARG